MPGPPSRLILLAAAAGALFLVPCEAEAARRGGVRFGIGGSLGDPMGPSAKLFLHPQHALQFDFGWAPMHHGDGVLNAAYLYHFKPFVSNKVMDFGLYLGVGAGLAFWGPHDSCLGGHVHGRELSEPVFRNHRHSHDHNDGHVHCTHRADRSSNGAALILRAPLGLFFHWQKVPLDTVLEGGWSPYVVLPDLPHGDFSIKLRYYF